MPITNTFTSTVMLAYTQQTATTVVVTYTTGAIPGDFVVINVVNNSASTVSSITDSAGNTYQQNMLTNNINGAARMMLFSSQVTSPIIGGTSTVSITYSGSTSVSIGAVKFTNTSAYQLKKDKSTTQSAQATTTTPSSGASGVLNAGNALVIVNYGFLGTPTFTDPSTFTNPFGTGVIGSTIATAYSTAMAYKVVAATASITATATLSVTEPSDGSINTFQICPTRFNSANLRPAPFKPGLAR